jgi:hypothetical protein
MDQKLTLRRLNQLYVDIDLPAFKPAAHTPQIDSEPESLPSPLEEQSPDLVVLPEAGQIEIPYASETTEIPDVSTLPLLADPSPGIIILPETGQIEVVDSKETAQPLDVSTLPMIADPIPAPAQAAGLTGRSSKTDGPRQADWKAIGIGAMTGSLVSGIILLVTSQMHIFNNPGRLALWSGEMFLGILGALIANSWRSTARELWKASIEWALFPVWFALLIGFILLLLRFTSLTG